MRDKTMRIGIDARFLQGPKRGQGQYVYYLIKELLELDGGSEVIAFYNSLRTGAFDFDRATPHLRQVWCNIPGTLLRQSWSMMRFPPAESLLGNIDVFHNPTNICFTHYTPIPSRAPMVATFNGMAHPSTIWKKYDQKKLDRWFREIANRASIIIAVSEMVKKDLLSRVYVPEERIMVIHYGVSGEFRPMDDKRAVNAVLSKYGLAGKRYLLYVGAAEPNKNLAALLDVFRGLVKNDGLEDVHLALAGNTSEDYRSLSDKAGALGLAQKVIFTGQIDHDDLPAVYNGAEAFVLPTIVEWFGIPVLEAMACGIPVAVSRNTGALEAVGDCAVLFDPRDPREMASSINEVLQNKSLRRSLAEKGIERVKYLSWKETARKTLAVYKEAVSLGRR